MKKIILIMLLAPTIAFAQLHRETVFGLDLPCYNWDERADVEIFGAEPYRQLESVYAVSNLCFSNGADSTDIILLLEGTPPRGAIYWIRAHSNRYPRPLQHLGSFGLLGTDSSHFFSPISMVIASDNGIYDPEIDHIYVGDLGLNCIVKLNFFYDLSNPANDAMISETPLTVDEQFAPLALAYLNLRTGNLRDNRLLALDYSNNRIVAFNHDGDLAAIIRLPTDAEPLTPQYQAFAWKPNDDNTVTLFILDSNNSMVKRYLYSRDSLVFLNGLALGEPYNSSFGQIYWHPSLGLWVSDGRVPRFIKLSEDLAEIQMEINNEFINRSQIPRPYGLAFLPNRLVVMDCKRSSSNLITFALEEPPPRPLSPQPGNLPLRFALLDNYPNPFNPNTSIGFTLDNGDWVKLEIFNILGQKVRTLVNAYRGPGRYDVNWDSRNNTGKEVASGIYFAKLTSGDNVASQKMALLK